MMYYLTEPRVRIFVKDYGFYYFKKKYGEKYR